MKKVVSVLLILLTILCFSACGHKEDKGLQLSGSYYENITEFSYEEGGIEPSVDNITGVTKAYLQRVNYVIVDLNEETKTATLEVSIPNVSSILPQIVTEILAENEGEDYEELLRSAKTRVEEVLSNSDVEKTSSTITLPFEEKDGEYRLICNEQWDQAVFGTLQDVYLEYYRTMIGGLLDEIPE